MGGRVYNYYWGKTNEIWVFYARLSMLANKITVRIVTKEDRAG